MPSDLREQLQASLAGTYAVERELGGGGMSRVFVATEISLGRRVVIKVLPPDLSAELSVERFRREIQLAAQLQNPHIVPLHSAGEAGGLLYYTMPFVDGESLRARIARDHELPLPMAVHVMQDVAKALSHAHRHGVVHRDIKPENILLSDGEALVADFGVAKALSASTAATEGSNITSAGFAIGTPAYMAPEQAVGDTSTDARADLYALGAVAYEMITGSQLFPGRSPQELIAAHTMEAPESIERRRPGIPAPLAALVMRLLAKRAADRPQSADQVVRELDTLVATGGDRTSAVPHAGAAAARRWSRTGLIALAIAAIIAGAAAIALARRADRAESPARTPRDASVAVLPFVHVSADQESEYFSDGMTEALIDALSKVPGLRVASRTSVFAFQSTGLDSRAIGEKLHAAAMLEGSFQRAGALLQVNVRLINAEDGYVLWSETFRRDQKDVFAVQDEISQAVVRALRLRLAGDRRPLVRQATENLEAYDLYLKGRWFWNQRAGGAAPLHRSIEYLREAIKLDSGYAAAWAGLADDFSLLPAFGDVAPADAYPEAKRAAERALALDSTLADAYTSLGIIKVFYDWDWPGAARAFDQALALDSTEPRAHLFHAWYYVAQGQLPQALGEVRRAQQLNPLSPIINARVGSVLYYMRRYDEATVELRQALELDSTNTSAFAELGATLAQQRRFLEAIAAFSKAGDLQAGHWSGMQGYAYGMAGRRDDASAIERHLTQLARDRYIEPQAFAMVAMGLGDTGRALDWLERGRTQHSFYLPFVAAEPIYRPLHGNARFLRLVQAIGLQFPGDTAR